MTLENLKRVMWRLRQLHLEHPSYNDLEVAIMNECGLCKATYERNKRALFKLGYCKRYTKKRLSLADKDLTDS
jgi:Ran GTPase-activating protein (RanGAP) involved in mRNA processing and transport